MGCALELTADERAEVELALASIISPEDVRGYYADMLSARRMVEKLGDAWGKMDEQARDFVRIALAEQAGVDDPWRLDIGQAAYEVTESIQAIRGRPTPLSGARTAAFVLFDIWVRRGHPPIIGKLRDDAGGYRPPYPLCAFVADQFLSLFADHYAKTHDPTQRRLKALIAADTQLRTLRERGQI